MKCQRCESKRVAQVCGKTSDMCAIQIGNKEQTNYVPKDMGLGTDADYLEFKYCLACGQIQGKFPLKPTEIEKD